MCRCLINEISLKMKNTFDELIAIAHVCDAHHNALKKELLRAAAGSFPKGKTQIVAYHNSLLFLLSYAVDEETLLLAQSEMTRLFQRIQKNENLKERLEGSGIAGTPVRSSFSFFLLRELFEVYKEGISLYSFDESGLHPKDVLKEAMPDMEYELTTNDTFNKEKWLQSASGTKDRHKQLCWLIQQINEFDCNDAIKEQLFDSLKVYVELSIKDKSFSRSFGRIHQDSYFYHTDGIQKKIDEQNQIRRELPREKKLTTHERNDIILASRAALCMLNRETDPVTYCNADGLKFYELERGLSIALFSMIPERRLPLESYIGFMMFKNGYPMSYGGAWLFSKRALIGINIFESFRGGESALVFANLLRTYSKAFGVSYFEVEPYQFGKHNPEGIKSGAFWFYYRFGFKPKNQDLRLLAEQEEHKIKQEKGYRSSFETLKKFTECNLYVDLSKSESITPDPLKISRYITQQIIAKHKADRNLAVKASSTALSKTGIKQNKENNSGYRKLQLFASMCVRDNATNRKALITLMNYKSGDEFRYVKALSLIDLNKILKPEVLSNE